MRKDMFSLLLVLFIGTGASADTTVASIDGTFNRSGAQASEVDDTVSCNEADHFVVRYVHREGMGLFPVSLENITG